MRLPRIGGKHYVGHLTGALCVTDRQSRHVENYSFGRIGKIKAAVRPLCERKALRINNGPLGNRTCIVWGARGGLRRVEGRSTLTR